jgi:hypothetical protein
MKEFNTVFFMLFTLLFCSPKERDEKYLIAPVIQQDSFTIALEFSDSVLKEASNSVDSMGVALQSIQKNKFKVKKFDHERRRKEPPHDPAAFRALHGSPGH